MKRIVIWTALIIAVVVLVGLLSPLGPFGSEVDPESARTKAGEQLAVAEAPPEKPAELTAEEILTKVVDRWSTVNDYHCRSHVFNKKGDETDTKLLQFSYKKPGMFRNEVIKGSNRGGVAVRTADGVLQGHTGILKVLILTLQPDDSRLRSIRGRVFFESDWGSELDRFNARLKEEGCKLTRDPDDKCEGADCWVIVAEGPPTDMDVTRDELWIEKDSHLIKRHREFEGEEMVTDNYFTAVELNTSPKDSYFKLK
jgi:hypothetical protein